MMLDVKKIMMTDSYVGKLGSISKSLSRKSCAAKLQEGWRHTVSKLRDLNLKNVFENSKGSNSKS